MNEHIGCNIVKIGRQFLRQKVGISQGSTLSNLFCSLYYGALDDLYLKELFQKYANSSSSIIRYVDDFLVFSTSRDFVEDFLRIMLNGIGDFNCFVNPAKCYVNYQSDFVGAEIADEWFPWCGLLINGRTLNVVHDYSASVGLSLVDALTIDHRLSFFRERVKRFVSQKLHAIYIDMYLNDRDSVSRNIYENYYLCCLKTLRYLFEANFKIDFVYFKGK